MAIQNSKGLFSAPFLKNVSKLFTINVVVGMVALLATPLLTRLYTPTDFTNFAVFMTMVGFLVILATMRLEFAIILPKSEEKALTLVKASIQLAIFIGFISAIALFFTKNFWARFFDLPFIGNWLWLVGPTVILVAVIQTLSQYFIRKEKFTQLALGQGIAGISNPGNKIALGLFPFLRHGLVWGYALSQVFGAVWLSVLFFRNPKINTKLKIGDVIKEYNDFPKFNMPHAISNFVAGNLPVILLIPAFGSYTIGLYSVAIMVVFKPISMIGNAIYQVLSQKTITDYHKKIPLLSETKTLIKQMFLIGILPTIVFGFFAPSLFSLALGQQYYEAGEYVRWLLPWLFMVFLTTPISFVPNLFKQQRNALFFDILYLMIRLLTLYIGVVQNSFTLAIALFSLVGVVMLLFYMFWMFRLLGNAEKDYTS